MQEEPASSAETYDRFVKTPPPPRGSPRHWTRLLSLLRLAGGVLASHDLVDPLPEAGVGGQPPGRLPQLLHAAVVGAAHRKRLGVFHCDQTTTRMSIDAASMSNSFLIHSSHPN